MSTFVRVALALMVFFGSYVLGAALGLAYGMKQARA